MLKKLTSTILFFTLLLLTIAFKAPKNIIEANKLQQEIESLLTTQPDTFKSIHLALYKDSSLFSLLINGNTNFALTRYYMQGRNSDSAEFHVKKAIHYFKDYPINLANAKMAYGTIFKQKGQYNEGLAQLKEALAIYKELNNVHEIAICKSTIATIYSKLGLTEASTSLLIESLDLLNQYPDTLKNERTRIKQLLAVNYQESQQWQFAEKIYLEIIPEFKESGQMYFYYITLLNLSEVLMNLNQLDEALRVINESINGLRGLKNTKLLALANVSKAKINLQLKNYKQVFIDLPKFIEQPEKFDMYQLRALNIYLELAVQLNKYDIASQIIERLKQENFEQNLPLNDLYNSYELMAKLGLATNNPQLELSALRSLILLNDSVDFSENNINNMALQEQYMNKLLIKENELNTLKSQTLAAKLKTARLVNLGIVISLVLLLIALVLGIRSYKLKIKLNLKKLEAKEEYNALLLENQKILEQKTEAQKSLLESQKRELLASTLKVNSLNERINDLIANTSDENHKKVLQSILSKEDYYDSFIEKFKSINPTFMGNLNEKYPELTNGELEFCALLKLNLSLKEIANILQITHESAITKKYRITKKLSHYENFDLNEAVQAID